jgi:hypothetical protein
MRRFFLFTLVFLAAAEYSWALPIFARRYATSCTTCHAIIPKLNPFGIAFRNNGYRIPANDAALVQTRDVSLGAPAWKDLWPEAVWPGAIQGMPPVAVRVSTEAEIEPSADVNLNFNFPSSLGLYFAGPAGDTFSFFGQVVMLGSNRLILDRAYGQFRLSPEKTGSNLLNLKIGRIDTRAEPFGSAFRRATLLGFNVSEYRSVSDAFSFGDHDAGIELWGAATGLGDRGGLEYGIGVVQGTDGDEENNNSKDYYWATSYKFGGLGVAGSRNIRETTLTATDSYSEWSLEFGGFGYYGKRPTETAGAAENQFTRSGLKFNAYLSDLNLYGAVVFGRDNIRGPGTPRIESSGMFVEADYMLLPWVMPMARYERTRFSSGEPVRTLVTGVNLAIRANVRAVVEGHFYNADGAVADPFGGETGERYTNKATVRLEFLF